MKKCSPRTTSQVLNPSAGVRSRKHGPQGQSRGRREGGRLLSVPQVARILTFSSGSLSLCPHLFLLQEPLPLPFPGRLESQMKTREKKNNQNNKKTNKHTNKTQKSWLLLGTSGALCRGGLPSRGGGALRREGRESGRERGPAERWSLANCVPLAQLSRGRGSRGADSPGAGDARRCPAVPVARHSPAPAGGEQRAAAAGTPGRPRKAEALGRLLLAA